ncbi:uncharacterized protein STAUR_2313 [Stigmatella aurantiaca DW4/3-1]|uniref:Uncharacterized protein n=1 Tax=Stigmatella aurantiaca (strain DW4/3-1) TaxID=378806 RepID=E3FDN8_STIAD|nr:uncharacterized protein STAUR_2313 [Stigmatella aurantiaca DW4/3-1]
MCLREAQPPRSLPQPVYPLRVQGAAARGDGAHSPSRRLRSPCAPPGRGGTAPRGSRPQQGAAALEARRGLPARAAPGRHPREGGGRRPASRQEEGQGRQGEPGPGADGLESLEHRLRPPATRDGRSRPARRSVGRDTRPGHRQRAGLRAGWPRQDHAHPGGPDAGTPQGSGRHRGQVVAGNGPRGHGPAGARLRHEEIRPAQQREAHRPDPRGRRAGGHARV